MTLQGWQGRLFTLFGSRLDGAWAFELPIDLEAQQFRLDRQRALRAELDAQMRALIESGAIKDRDEWLRASANLMAKMATLSEDLGRYIEWLPR